MRRLLAGLAAAVVLALAGCGTSSTPAPPTGTPPATSTPAPTASTGVTSAAQAAALVMASDPRFGLLAPPNPELVGACCSYDVVEAAPGYNVTIDLGWGDCEAGCISHHKWLFHVDLDGTIALLEETGDEPVEFKPVSGPGPARVTVVMRAGPTCPAVAVPPQPGCEPRLIANAEVILRAASGVELATGTSDDQGQVLFNLPSGAYYIEPQPVAGIIGPAQPLAFSVVSGSSLTINVDYDTGIR